MWLFFALLAAAMWAAVNVADSILIHKYEKRPIVIMWVASLLRIPILCCFIPFMVHTTLWPQLMLAGVILYGASLIYLYIMNHIDTSVTQSAWAIESIILSMLGFFLLRETWTSLQSVGALLILCGVFLLSYWHKHISVVRTIGLLLVLAIVAAPAEFLVKITLDEGVPILTAMFWYMLGRDSLSLLWPLLKNHRRVSIFSFVRGAPKTFYAVFMIDLLLSFGGFFSQAKSYAIGPISLVSIVGNTQPFIVILLAWMLTRMKSIHVPKELLTRQSIQVKVASFAFVFVGLALLT